MVNSETELPENRIHILDPVVLRNDGYGCNRASNYAIQPRRPNSSSGLRSYHSFTDENSTAKLMSYDSGGLRLRVKTTLDDEPDLSSPRLWMPGSPLLPTSLNSVSFSHLQHPNNHYCHPMSPNSRSQAIARGQKELMEMVRDLPESFYELSLKDIVEQKPDLDAHKEINLDLPEKMKPVMEMTNPNETKQEISSKRGKKREIKRKIARSKSIENERFLLKTSVFPVFFRSKKSKKNVAGSGSFRVAPIPKPQPTPSGSMKGVEKDWWRRKSCISSESDDSSGLSNSGSSRSSSSSSRSSSSSTRRHSKRLLPSCCFFIGRKIRGRK